MLINGFNDSRLREIVSELYLDDAADLVEEMPAGVVSRILKNTDKETRNAINEILMYPKDSVGSMMTTEYVSLKKSMTVAEAIAKIRRVGVDKETIYTCYVTENRRLLGTVTVKALLLANDDERLIDLMEEDPISEIGRAHV